MSRDQRVRVFRFIGRAHDRIRAPYVIPKKGALLGRRAHADGPLGQIPRRQTWRRPARYWPLSHPVACRRRTRKSLLGAVAGKTIAAAPNQQPVARCSHPLRPDCGGGRDPGPPYVGLASVAIRATFQPRRPL